MEAEFLPLVGEYLRSIQIVLELNEILLPFVLCFHRETNQQILS